MRQKKIIFVLGTRPEAIKLAPVIIEAQKQRDLSVKFLATAQHRELLDEVLQIFGIVPDFDLNVMRGNQSLSDVTAKVVKGVEETLKKERPDWVLIQGDTTTVLATALACYYQKILVAHVEAGLRTYNKYQPFPEEINRTLVSHVADFNFCPTEGAAKNLRREGIDEAKIVVTGNTVIDALFLALKKPVALEKELREIDFSRRIILLTAHRRENFGKPLTNICLAVKDIVGRFDDVEVIYPVHPNPNIQKTVRELLSNYPRIHLLSPLNYLSFCHLMQRSYLILTDSGGIQEEAPSLNKPVLVLREVTERPEAVEVGAAKVVGTNGERIIKEATTLLSGHNVYDKMAAAPNPFGDGKAAERIVELLVRNV